MQLDRRQFLHLTAGTAALPALSCSAWAQAYPAKPVYLIVTFPAGSAPDISKLRPPCRTPHTMRAILLAGRGSRQDRSV